MNANKFEKQNSFKISNITIFFILIYIVLFEFTWATQNVFPKPSQLIESFLSLVGEYNLLNGFYEITAIIFPALLLAVIILEVFIKFFLLLFINYNGVKNISAPVKYFSFFFFALLFNLLFPNTLLTEFVFALVFILGRLLQVLLDSTETASEEYILTAKSLGLSNGQILSKVLWKDLKPKIYSKLIPIHTQVWVIIVVYEFVGAINGVGAIYRLAFDYNDLLAIVSLGVFISLVILIVNFLLKSVVSKLIFWK